MQKVFIEQLFQPNTKERRSQSVQSGNHVVVVGQIYQSIWKTAVMAKNFVARHLTCVVTIISCFTFSSFFLNSVNSLAKMNQNIEPLRKNLEIVSLCKILQFSLLNFDWWMGGPKFTTLLNWYCSSGLEFTCVTTGALLSVVVCGQSLTN